MIFFTLLNHVSSFTAYYRDVSLEAKLCAIFLGAMNPSIAMAPAVEAVPKNQELHMKMKIPLLCFKLPLELLKNSMFFPSELHTQIVAVSFAVLSDLFFQFHSCSLTCLTFPVCYLRCFPFFYWRPQMAMRRLPTKPLRYGAEEVGGEADLRAAVRLLGRHHRAELAGWKWRW